MRKILFIFSFFFVFGKISFSQKAIISQPAMNVFYIGILNEINIGLEGYKNKDIVKEISDGEFIEKDRKTFVKVKNRGQVWIKIGIRKKGQNIWKDSLVFRVRELPKPIPQMGTMQDGSIESVGVIRANANRMFMALGSGFSVKGVSYKVFSFRISVVGLMGYVSENIQGSSINGNAQKFLQSLQNGSVVFIDDIYYYLDSKDDTIIETQKSSESIKIISRGGNNNPYILGFNDDNYPTYRWSFMIQIFMKKN